MNLSIASYFSVCLLWEIQLGSRRGGFKNKQTTPQLLYNHCVRTLYTFELVRLYWFQRLLVV